MSASALRCAACGVRYARSAMRRQLSLVAGARCQRCGGTLEREDRESRPERRALVLERHDLLSRALSR